MKLISRIAGISVLMLGFLVLMWFIGPMLDKGNMFQGMAIIIAAVVGYIGIAGSLYYEFTRKPYKPNVTMVPPRNRK